MRYLVVSLLLLSCACTNDRQRDFSLGACQEYGVSTPVEVPKSCPLEIEGDGETARLFAIGAVIRYEEMESYAAFCKAWDDVVRTEVLPCLSDDKPNLLVFPENATLAGAFIGSRGTAGRAETASIPAFFSLFNNYADPIRYYAQQFPEASANERLVLGITDTLHRAFQTFPAMAKQYGVYVAVSSDFAPAELSEDPALLEILGDPDLDSVSSVYVATEGTGYNWGLYFGPDGEEIGRVAKSYLVPAEEDVLDLSHGPLIQMRPIDLSFARSGMVISKDAWMPGVLHRLDALGANLMLQPEAFSGWGVEEYEGDWLPDIVRQSAWAHTQRHGAFRHTVTPCIKGNLFELPFDCQSHVTSASSPSDTARSFIGQDPYLGLLAVEPWVIEDPGPPASLEERRATLRDRGERMLPGSGDPLEDAYAAGVIAANVALPLDGRVPSTGDGEPGAFGPSTLVAEPRSAATHQRFPSLASDGDSALIAWMEGAPGEESVRAFITNLTSPAEEVELDEAGDVVQRLPRVAVAAGRMAVVWEEESRDQTARVVVATRAGESWRQMAITEPGVGTAWEPDVAIDPVTGNYHVTWLDLRNGGRPKPWVARSEDGESWETRQVDPGNAIVDNPRGDAAFPKISARDGSVFVAFSDFREFSWDVYLSASGDGGLTFAPATRINPRAKDVIPVPSADPIESERIHGDIAIALDSSGRPSVAWTERQDRRYESRIRVWREGETARVDDAPGTIDAWRPSLATDGLGQVLTVWQDMREGTNQIRFAQTAGPSLEFNASVRIDDAAPATHLYAPQIANHGEQILVAWEDPRSGYARVRISASD